MRYPHEFAYVPTLPNHGSPHQTPSSLYVDVHYANLLLLERWTWTRFVNLCQCLKMTPYEVASLVMLSHRSVETFKEGNRLAGPAARPVALLLTILEHQLLGEMWHDTIKNPFPDITTAATEPAKAGR